MNYCLDKKEFQEFFDAFLSKDSLNDTFGEDLQMRIDACMNWEDTLGVLLYIFTHYLQKKAKSDPQSSSEYINRLFQLNEVGNFILEPLDRDFIQYMFGYSRAKIKEDLPDSLTLILQNYLDRSYDSSYCF